MTLTGDTVADSTKTSPTCKVSTGDLHVDKYVVMVKSANATATVKITTECNGKHLKEEQIPKGCADFDGCDSDGNGKSPCFTPKGSSSALKCTDGKAEDVIKGKAPHTCATCPAGYQAAGSGEAWECGKVVNSKWVKTGWSCVPGDKNNGKAGCEDLDDCSFDAKGSSRSSHPCGIHKFNSSYAIQAGTCRDVGTLKYECSCVSGFRATNSDNGPVCTQINPCADGEDDDCDSVSKCTHTGPGKHECLCPQKASTGNGKRAAGGCKDINKCDGHPKVRVCGKGLSSGQYADSLTPCMDANITTELKIGAGFLCPKGCPAGTTDNNKDDGILRGIQCGDIDDCSDNPCQDGNDKASYGTIKCTDSGSFSNVCSCPSGMKSVKGDNGETSCQSSCSMGGIFEQYKQGGATTANLTRTSGNEFKMFGKNKCGKRGNNEAVFGVPVAAGKSVVFKRLTGKVNSVQLFHVKAGQGVNSRCELATALSGSSCATSSHNYQVMYSAPGYATMVYAVVNTDDAEPVQMQVMHQSQTCQKAIEITKRKLPYTFTLADSALSSNVQYDSSCGSAGKVRSVLKYMVPKGATFTIAQTSTASSIVAPWGLRSGAGCPGSTWEGCNAKAKGNVPLTYKNSGNDNAFAYIFVDGNAKQQVNMSWTLSVGDDSSCKYAVDLDAMTTDADEFTAKLGPAPQWKQNFKGGTFTFRKIKIEGSNLSPTRLDTYQLQECKKVGMKPICDHPSYCRTDTKSLYIGQTHHLAYAPYRDRYPNFFPTGFAAIRTYWNAACSYTGRYGTGGLCNWRQNTHSWQYSNNARVRSDTYTIGGKKVKVNGLSFLCAGTDSTANTYNVYSSYMKVHNKPLKTCTTSTISGKGTPEEVFTMMVPAGATGRINIDNFQSSVGTTALLDARWGGSCTADKGAGTNQIVCSKSTATPTVAWKNTQSAAQKVFFTLEPSGSASGTSNSFVTGSYTVSWDTFKDGCESVKDLSGKSMGSETSSLLASHTSPAWAANFSSSCNGAQGSNIRDVIYKMDVPAKNTVRFVLKSTSKLVLEGRFGKGDGKNGCPGDSTAFCGAVNSFNTPGKHTYYNKAESAQTLWLMVEEQAASNKKKDFTLDWEIDESNPAQCQNVTGVPAHCDDQKCEIHNKWMSFKTKTNGDNYLASSCCTSKSGCGEDMTYQFNVPSGAQLSVKIAAKWKAKYELRSDGICGYKVGAPSGMNPIESGNCKTMGETTKTCAWEGGSCKCAGQVRYGYDRGSGGNKWSGWRSVSSSISCTNGVFGDPWPGVRKICQCKSNGGGNSQEMTFTAKELRQCTKDDTHQNIPDYGKASASTVWANQKIGYSHGAGRIDSNQGWSARYNRKDEWWQFDLGSLANIAGVRTMRRKSSAQRITQYSVGTNTNGKSKWDYVDNAKLFTGNTENTETVVENLFNAPVRGQYVRWVVKKWSSHVSGRFAVMTCAGHFSSDNEAERLNNGGFEVGQTGQIPTSWKRYGRYGNTGLLYKDQAKSGSASAKFWNRGWQLI